MEEEIEESPIDENGIKIIKTTKIEDGKKVCIEQKVKIIQTTKRVSKTVQHRRQLKKFGASKTTPVGLPDPGTVHFGETVSLDLTPRNQSNIPSNASNASSSTTTTTANSTANASSSANSNSGGAGNSKDSTSDAASAAAAAAAGSQKLVVCRICGKQGDHWTLKCPLKDKLGGTALVNEALAGKNPSKSGLSSTSTTTTITSTTSSSSTSNTPSATVIAAAASEKSGKYVPPSLRQGGGGSGGGGGDGGRRGDSGGRPERDDSNTVRVANLSSDATEADIRDLFQRCGYISRVYLARDSEGVSKGFAFVSYTKREDAEKAIAKLNGHGYDHLILSVSFADAGKLK